MVTRRHYPRASRRVSHDMLSRRPSSADALMISRYLAAAPMIVCLGGLVAACKPSDDNVYTLYSGKRCLWHQARSYRNLLCGRERRVQSRKLRNGALATRSSARRRRTLLVRKRTPSRVIVRVVSETGQSGMARRVSLRGNRQTRKMNLVRPL
jgi:hypothetical protein